MNRNTKLVLLISLFGLVCLAILWGRWFPDNRQQETDDLGYGTEADLGSFEHPDLARGDNEGSGFPIRRVDIGAPTAGFEDPASAAGVARPPAREADPQPISSPRSPPLAAAGGSERSAPGGELEGWTQYAIRENDALWKIAARYLGDGNRFNEILKANPGLDPAKLKVGRVIRIPPRDGGSGGGAASYSPPPERGGSSSSSAPASSYEVKPGDSFSRIARRQLGSERRWKEIPQINGLSEDAVLSPGQKLKLPAR